MESEHMATPPTNMFAKSYNDAPSFTNEERESMAQGVATSWHLSDVQPLGSSTWWNSEKVGADFYRVTQGNDQPAVLKMQYAPTNPSEIVLLTDFATYAQTTQSPVRPPHLYKSQQRDQEHPFEALLLEDVQGKHILPHPANSQEVAGLAAPLDKLLELAQAAATVPSHSFPQLPQTAPETAATSVQEHFASWQEFRNLHFADHVFTLPQEKGEVLSDPNLITQAIQTLAAAYEKVPLRFQHGHMGRGDIVQATDGTIVLFSSLKWGWYVPYRNVAFHEWWYLYECSGQENLSIEDIAAIHQQQEQAFSRLAATLSPEEQHLLTLARLERATAALNLDVLTLPDNERTRKAAELTRQTVVSLLTQIPQA